MKDDRDIVMQRIREALQISPIRPVSDEFGDPSHRDMFPVIGSSHEELRARFVSECESLAAEVVTVEDPDRVEESWLELSRRWNWQNPALHSNPLVDRLAAAAGWSKSAVRADNPHTPRRAIEPCDVGITACDALVAQTGSVVWTAASAGGRVLSILVPHHVVVAPQSHIVPDLAAAIHLIAAHHPDLDRRPSALGLETGPSRTGDIERILVLGAHGPKRLTIFIVP